MKEKKKMPIWCSIIVGLIIAISIISIIAYISEMNTRKAQEKARLELQQQLQLQQQQNSNNKNNARNIDFDNPANIKNGEAIFAEYYTKTFGDILEIKNMQVRYIETDNNGRYAFEGINTTASKYDPAAVTQTIYGILIIEESNEYSYEVSLSYESAKLASNWGTGNKVQGSSSAEDSKIQKNPIATMEVEGYGTIKIELYPEIAPNTVKNFIALANRGFYDGLKFHRVVEGFMIQGGDPAGNGSGGPTLSDLGIGTSKEEYCIKGEFAKNGHENSLSHDVGVISMARADYTAYSPSLTSESYNSGGSQFFIMTEKSEYLDGSYATFGKVIEGMDVVEKIENVNVYAKTSGGEVSTPVKAVTISKVTVETYGKDYGLPETLEPFDFNK